MFQKNTIFKPCESSGILKFKCIHVYYKKKVLIGTYGDFFKGSIRLIKSSSKRLKRNKYKSISILMRSSFKKLDGSSLFFKTNSCLNLKKRLTPLGKYVKGPVIYNMKRKKILQSFTKIILMKSNLFNYINIKNKNSEAHLNSNLKTLNLNFGPQHPAAHGVLRLILKMNNEVIDSCDPHIGLLHRGTEKLMENKIYIHSLPYFDRLDYVSTLLQEQCYSIAVDKLYNKNVYTSNLVMTRCVLDELTRVLNHLLAISCHALDVGSMSPIF